MLSSTEPSCDLRAPLPWQRGRGHGEAHLEVVGVLSDHVLGVLDQVRGQRLGVLLRTVGLQLQLCATQTHLRHTDTQRLPSRQHLLTKARA